MKLVAKLKKLWHEDWIVIRLNKKVIYILLGLLALLYSKNYFYDKGAMDAFKYDLQQQNDKKHESDDAETHNLGHLDHSKDNPQI